MAAADEAARRWQAAFGAIAASLLIDPVDQRWSPRGARSIQLAEDLLAGGTVPVDLTPADAIPASIALAVSGCPLLVDTTTVETIDLMRAALDDEPVDPERIAAITDPVAVAGLAGVTGGAGSIRGRAVSSLRSPDGRRGRRYLSGLTHRLLGTQRPGWYDPKRRRGPKEVLDGLWLANIHGVARFVDDHPDGLVLSLCDIEGRIDDHPNHITFHLDDTPRPDANPRLPDVLDDVLDEVATARAAGTPLLVHCRHGASRTGLVLRAILGAEHGLSPEDALMEAQALWSATSSWNTAWPAELARRAGVTP